MHTRTRARRFVWPLMAKFADEDWTTYIPQPDIYPTNGWYYKKAGSSYKYLHREMKKLFVCNRELWKEDFEILNKKNGVNLLRDQILGGGKGSRARKRKRIFDNSAESVVQSVTIQEMQAICQRDYAKFISHDFPLVVREQISQSWIHIDANNICTTKSHC